jgi:hypothetical protein
MEFNRDGKIRPLYINLSDVSGVFVEKNIEEDDLLGKVDQLQTKLKSVRFYLENPTTMTNQELHEKKYIEY